MKIHEKKQITFFVAVLAVFIFAFHNTARADPDYDPATGILTIPKVTINMTDPPLTNVQLKLVNGVFELAGFDNCGNSNETAQYMVTFEATWSSTTHPDAYPSNAHFSPFIGFSHAPEATIFSPGATASAGIQNMAETGGTSPLDDEIDLLIQAGFGLEKIKGSVFDSPGSESATFMVDADHPFVTVTSMIAPSPDWFVAVRNLNLYENCQWVDSAQVDVTVYDAGTDSGADLTSANEATTPAESISLITTGPLAENNTVTNMGTMTFTKIN